MQEQPVVGDTTSKPESHKEASQTEGSQEQGSQLHASEPNDAGAEPAQAAGSSGEPGAPSESAGTAGTDPAPQARREESAVVALPGLHRQEQPKTSFWKRIRLSRRGGVRSATDDDRMISRLDAIAERIEARERDLAERIELLDRRLDEVWEVEEQLSRLTELRELLGDVQERQGRIDGRTRTMARRLSWIASLAVVAAAAALGALGVALL